MLTEATALSVSLLVFTVIGPTWILWLLLAFTVGPADGPHAEGLHD